jgi:Protein of unknown function (DUF3572)
MSQRPPASSGDDGELIAISALCFLADRPEEFERFLALSGVDPTEIRRLAGNADFLGGLLDFLLADEALLLVFAAEAGLAPDRVVAARRHLDRGRRALDSGED